MKILGKIFGKRHYLLTDGMHSCVYIPKHTYAYLNKMLIRSLDADPKGENSLRFVWSRTDKGYILAVNPHNVEMTQTHGLARDCKGRVLIPCPYLQQIYCALGLDPEYCGRVYVDQKKQNNALLMFNLIPAAHGN